MAKDDQSQSGDNSSSDSTPASNKSDKSIQEQGSVNLSEGAKAHVTQMVVSQGDALPTGGITKVETAPASGTGGSEAPSDQGAGDGPAPSSSSEE
jgi:hypothetical protein